MKLSNGARALIQRMLKRELTYEEALQELITSARGGRQIPHE